MMSIPANDLGYAAAANAYWEVGWRGILPLKRGFKSGRNAKLPVGFTGHEGVEPSYADVTAWSEDRPDDNLCLRLPDGIIGIDVDAYGAKTGGEAFTEAVKRWGGLPDAPRSGSRENVSGIRLFRVPPGTRLSTKIEFPELGIGDIEVIQRHHRYVVAWPSIHPEGRGYWWRNEAGQMIGIPDPSTLPWLPQAWIDALKIKPRELNLNGATYDIRSALTTGEPDPSVRARVNQAIKELNLPGHSRHDTTCAHVLALLRLGKNGRAGVAPSLDLLREVFVATVSSDRTNGADEARDEFDRMITNDNAARELAQVNLTDWMKDLTIEPETVSTDPAESMERAANANAQSDNGRSQPEPSRPRSRLEEIEQGFWDSRESLQMVWQTSMAMMASPWGVLAHCAARALTQVRPHVTLPPLIGGPGSLNWFALVAAPPSLGKGTAARTAKLLVPDPIVEWEVGSGEGMIAVYGRTPEERIEAIMFKAEEMDSISALNSRTGSTTLAILRSGFFAEGLGSAYSDEKKCRRLEDGAYRMTLIVSTQPERAAWLLADAGGGTPQRFMWFPGSDRRVTAEESWPSGPLTLPQPGEWQYPREIIIPDSIRRFLRENHAKNCRGETDALNGHALFSREKLAYALAVLDGRVSMTLEDWELSGIAAEVSAHTRDTVIETIEQAAKDAAAERGQLRGIEMAAMTTMKAFEDLQQWPRVIRWVRDRLDTAGDEGITQRELCRAAPKTIRQYVPTALKQLAADGLAANPEKTTWTRL